MPAPLSPHPCRPNPFLCSWTDDGPGAATVHVAGELDLATASTLSRVLAHAQLHADQVTLDLRELDFMDSAGMHLIVDATGRARALGGHLTIVRGPAAVHRTLTLTQATDLLDIVDQPDHARAVRPCAAVGYIGA